MSVDELNRIIRGTPDVLNNKRKLKSVLMDCMHDKTKERNLLVLTVDYGIVEEIYSKISFGAFDADAFVRVLVNDYGLSQENAVYSITVWSEVIHSFLYKPHTESKEEHVLNQQNPFKKSNQNQITINRQDKQIVSNYIVIDGSTGLMWQDDNDTESQSITCHQAIEYAKDLRLGGFDDWRLPTKNEPRAIIDTGDISIWKRSTFHLFKPVYPAIKSVLNYCRSSFYWSSIVNSLLTSSVWGVDFKYGSICGKLRYLNAYVWCARDGKLLHNTRKSIFG